LNCDLNFGTYDLKISAADNLVQNAPAAGAKGFEHACCWGRLRIFRKPSIGLFWLLATETKQVMHGEFGFGFCALMPKEFFEVVALDEPRHLAAVNNQTLVFDPTDDRLAMPPNRLRRFPDSVDVVGSDPVRRGKSSHHSPSEGNGPDVFWQTCAASQASTSSSRYNTRAPILRNLGPLPNQRHCSSVLGDICHRAAN
jgi:hypothetical protein